ncbi:MAG: NADH-quinone oxidoreductase subunit M [Acidobacteriota bacterium]
MTGLDGGILSLLVLVPTVGAVAVVLFGRVVPAKNLALLVALATFALSLHLPYHFRPAESGFQFVQELPWIPSLGIGYHVGVDGISMPLVLLTTFLMPISVLCSFKAIDKREPFYYACILLTSAGILGVFIALDLFLFYVFWEAMLIPMYFLIGIWGGPRRVYATTKFVLYTMVGSLLMLVAILVTYLKAGGQSFDYAHLLKYTYAGSLGTWLFLAYFLAFAIKVPLFPFHTWLPDAHVEAPTAGSVLLAGVLLKMGTYGLVRFAVPLYPEAARYFAPSIAVISVIGIIYGALLSLAQTDLKKLVAYSSVSHLGFVVLGIFAFGAEGLTGATIQMVNHGLSTGALFLMVGMVYERTHTRDLAKLGGLFKVMPVYGALLMLTALSSAALPGTNGFVGEFLILLGAFRAYRIACIFAVTGVIGSAAYLLYMVEKTLFGPVTNEENAKLADLSLREKLVLAPVLALVLLIGVRPAVLLAPMAPTVKAYFQLLRDRTDIPEGKRAALVARTGEEAR